MMGSFYNKIKVLLGVEEKETNPILSLFLDKKCVFFFVSLGKKYRIFVNFVFDIFHTVF